MASKERAIRILLTDGTPEGVRIIDCGTTVLAFVVPRLKLAEAKNYEELSRPALYFLINTDGDQAYVGEAENFYNRIKNHDQNKDWWDVAVAFVSATKELDKAGVKYLESLAVERAQNGSIRVENKTAPVRNHISRFDVGRLENMLEDAQLILTSLNYDVLASPQSAKEDTEDVWYINHKGVSARGEYRGSQFVIFAGSTMHVAATDAWKRDFPNQSVIRETVLADKADVSGDVATIKENLAFKSVSMAAGIIIGGHTNGWLAWKNSAGKTMDEVIRKAAE